MRYDTAESDPLIQEFHHHIRSQFDYTVWPFIKIVDENVCMPQEFWRCEDESRVHSRSFHRVMEFPRHIALNLIVYRISIGYFLRSHFKSICLTRRSSNESQSLSSWFLSSRHARFHITQLQCNTFIAGWTHQSVQGLGVEGMIALPTSPQASKSHSNL